MRQKQCWFAESVGTLSVGVNDANAAAKFGEWFGAGVAGMVLSFYICEQGMPDDSAVNEFSSDLLPMLTTLEMDLKDEAKLRKGIVITGSAPKFLIAWEIQGNENGNWAAFTMKMRVSSNTVQDLNSLPGPVSFQAECEAWEI